ncbi:MAG: pyridoxal-phosphate dependent enzyme [Myxococcota bacterium]
MGGGAATFGDEVQACRARPERPLHRAFPALADALPWFSLGDFPTPVEPLRLGGREDVWIKRDDRSSPVYGGNKVRTLEVLFAQAVSKGATRIVATGAYGTNHGAATLLHAPRVGLEPELLLFPQPKSYTALENLERLVGDERRAPLLDLPHWSALPFGMIREKRRGAVVMPPGGATATGAIGYASAGFELAEQIAAGALPRPETLVVGVGSTCTTAGLLLGLHLAERRGLGDAPHVRAVRVTPWPVTAPWRIVALAVRAGRLLAELTGDASVALGRAELAPGLSVEGRELGRGYGCPTDAGIAAIRRFRDAGGPELDTTYSAKAAAGFLRLVDGAAPGPLLFWSTKSSAPLPEVVPAALAASTGRVQRWAERARRWERP